MNKKEETPAEQLVKETVAKIKKQILELNLSKWEVAVALLWANEVLTWRLTPYGSWESFCITELHLAKSTIGRYLTVARKVRRFGYADDDVKELIEALGWTRFCYAVTHIIRKTAVKTLIKQYKDFQPSKAREGNRRLPNGDRAYTFSLPEKVADKLDGYLHHFGMTEDDYGNRRGVRSAMIDLVNIQLD